MGTLIGLLKLKWRQKITGVRDRKCNTGLNRVCCYKPSNFLFFLSRSLCFFFLLILPLLKISWILIAYKLFTMSSSVSQRMHWGRSNQSKCIFFFHLRTVVGFGYMFLQDTQQNTDLRKSKIRGTALTQIPIMIMGVLSLKACVNWVLYL